MPVRACVRFQYLRSAFDALILLKKISLILLAAFLPDPFLAPFLSLLVTVAILLVEAMWKPFRQQFSAVMLQSVLLSLQVRVRRECACDWCVSVVPLLARSAAPLLLLCVCVCVGHRC